MEPAAWLPAMPIALAVASTESPRSFEATIAAANAPHVPVGWNPRS